VKEDFWGLWLGMLMLMHERHETYDEFMASVHEEWLDRCIMVDHARMVARLYL